MTRLPERDLRAQEAHKGGFFRWRPGNLTVAIIFILILTVGPYLAFTKHIPFTSYGFEVKATFANSANIANNSPVRIAGVDVGKVVSTERDGNDTTVTFTVSGDGQPIHEDAFATIRPRIFLEGNFFIELSPGSPSAPSLSSGETIPVSQTATAVQIDQVLSALQSPVRADLSHLLESYGNALKHQPTAAENANQLPEVRGVTGAGAINGAFKYGGAAGRYSSVVTNALLGTQQRDLSKLVASAGRTFSAFAANQEDLQGLITNFDTFTGALADQSTNLATTVHLLAPTLQVTHTSLVDLDKTLPPLRTYAIELRPAVAELPELISASKPWLAQMRPLLSGKEGLGLAKLLAKSAPGLAGAAREGNRNTVPQINRLSLCGSQVLIPTGNEVINDQFSTGGPNYREFLYLLTDFVGASQNFDGNGPMIRAQFANGPKLVAEPNPEGNPNTLSDQIAYSHVTVDPQGTQPQIGKKPPLKPEVRCDANPVPDVNAGLGQVGPASPTAAGVNP
ncbi:MAG TPA: MlaD family protein [Solirubrobacterales bacterium]|jgi:ABC-type transporter Mla subunit MlaD